MEWKDEERDAIAHTDEVRVASRRSDGTLSPDVIVWAVVADGTVYARSAHGSDNGWYRRALRRGRGRIRAGRVEREVTFVHAADGPHAEIDAAYRVKYARYTTIVPHITGPAVHDVTVRIDPVETTDGGNES
ncbi:MAG: DUF2255 family protein [Microbacteriaceae bacterium]|nr:DUF2255 family protein [Microbacteriaceae bacterium]